MIDQRYRDKSGQAVQVVGLLKNGSQPAYADEVHEFRLFLQSRRIKFVTAQGTILPNAVVVIYQDVDDEWYMRSLESFQAMFTEANT